MDHDVFAGRDARLMRQLGIRGATRAVKRFTAHADLVAAIARTTNPATPDNHDQAAA